ncbi:hypothetical protein COEREDRAFT_83384 [Coemansia reversa NRRL 1564]|uniref:Uncharacterized protein n=1 Tax=Coemansia reversa (strain ATCC 12441 / NRRL 1564) TaxID=763665 RepID=A0A2G5B3K6_COERN|nr:hypothetical protein COEREDRAFT_83384 [Coemansia reversa NRRL 1564]|eukprot:PIA13584.1 hypothetical protein COEREDRAFT_83384 [Coemansia reversa NRRL 1564]
MDTASAYSPLLQRAVSHMLQAGIIYTEELNVGSIEEAVKDIIATVENAGETGQRDLEYTMHTHMLDLAEQLPEGAVQRVAQKSTESDIPQLNQMIALTDIAILLSDTGRTDASFAFTLLEESMDMISIGLANVLFEHIERRAAELRRDISATGGKGIVMLRMCNSLLRRIPHSTMSEFAGRVQIFVANSFSLSERSGVNLRGDFDHSNIPQARETNSEDKSLYQSFWLLQRYFATPTLLTAASKEGGFPRFLDAATQTLEEFRKMTNSRAPTLTLELTGAETLRHLTSPALLRMQLGDPQFKCQILLQLLIFIKYVLSMCGNRLQTLREKATNKFVVNDLSLEAGDQEKLLHMRHRVGNQLINVANDRGLFSRTAQFVVFHESAWTRWKAESCKPFEAPSVELIEEMQQAARFFLQVEGVSFPESNYPMGSSRLATLWETNTSPNRLRGLGDDVRGLGLLPAMRNLDIYCREDGDYELLTATEQIRADLLQWRALRSSVHDNMFRRVDPSSHALAALREEVLTTAQTNASVTNTMDVEN